MQSKGYTELHGHGFLSMRDGQGASAFSLRLVKVTKVNKSTWHDVIIQTDTNGVWETGKKSCHECMKLSKKMCKSEMGQTPQKTWRI